MPTINYLDKNGLSYFWDKIDAKKQDKLTAGSNITISGNTISASQPKVNNGTLTIQKNGTNVQTFTANQGTNATANITVPTKTSDLTNDSGFLDSVAWGDVTGKPTFATVATSGSYNDLSNKPTIPTVNNATLTIQKNGTTVQTFTANQSTNATANITVPTKTSDLTNDSGFLDSVAWGDVTGKPTFATVATSGSYNDLSNKPTIPTVNNGQLTIQKNGSNVATFTANQSGNSTANISVPTKTSDLTNDGADNTSTYIETDDAQKFAIGQGSTNPVFDEMTPVKTIEWDVTDSTYRPIYQMANTGWTYINMDITVAYRITVTGTNINSVTDIVDRWHNPVSYPITSMFCRTLSTSAATTGFRYLRAVYPVSAYLNNASYPLGTEIAMYNTTARHVKIEVFKDNSQVTWNTTKPSGPIYVSSTYNGNSSMTAYDTRGWRFRQPVQMYAQNAGYAGYVSDFEAVNTSAGELKTGATALVAGHYAFLADDGRVYDISNTAKNIAMGESKVGFMNSAVAANTAISYTYWRAISRPNATQVGYIPHDTLALGNRVFLRCTMDSNGNVHSDNRLSTTMSAGYTWMPFGWARSASTIYVDTRFPKFYTLDSNGKLTHIDGKEIATGMTSVAWEDITNKPTFATVATSGSYNDLSNKPTIPAAQVQSNWTQTTTTAVDYIKNKPTLATVATSGSYNDLSNKPTIPTVNNATLTIQKNGTTVKTFTANASSNVTANITVPTKTSDLTNDSGFLDSVAWGDVTGKPTFATVATSGSYNDLSNKPTIPAAVTVDSALSSTSKNPVQNKVINTALNGKQASLSTAQLNAANSGITSAKVTTYDGYASQIATKADISALDDKQDTLTAGDHIDITNDTISATGYVHSDDPVSTTSSTATVTGSMIANGTITADKLATGATLKLTLSTTDIGEGAALAANTLYGVYQ